MVTLTAAIPFCLLKALFAKNNFSIKKTFFTKNHLLFDPIIERRKSNYY